MQANPIEILLVEDSPGDVELIREGLRRCKVINRLHVAMDGVEAMAHLRDPSSANSPRPNLVLLDINLPRMNGHEVLAEIRAAPELRTIPVIILTTSSHDNDVLQAYEHHANAYVNKPLDADRFLAVLREIEGFWLNVVRLPPTSN